MGVLFAQPTRLRHLYRESWLDDYRRISHQAMIFHKNSEQVIGICQCIRLFESRHLCA